LRGLGFLEPAHVEPFREHGGVLGLQVEGGIKENPGRGSCGGHDIPVFFFCSHRLKTVQDLLKAEG